MSHVITIDNLQSLAWQKMDGLLPAIVQHAISGKVLMQGYMNLEAVEVTLRERKVTFFSRSKQRLWQKGETSGHCLQLRSMSSDCDHDSLLVLAEPIGPTCHTGAESCWFDGEVADFTFLADLETVLASRKHTGADTSYTSKLYASGIKRIAQKVGEEGVETALAATVGDIDELKNEAADLLYHLTVLLQASQLQLADVLTVLRQRHKPKL